MVEDMEYNNLKLSIWDQYNSTKIRPLYQHYYLTKPYIVFIIDSTDRDKIYEAYNEFHTTLFDISILLFCNKQDLSNAMTPKDIQLKMVFYREKKYKESDLKEISTNSMIKYLPLEIFNLIMEYAKDYQNGICVKWTTEQLKFKGISLIDQSFGIDTDNNFLKSYNCDYD